MDAWWNWTVPAATSWVRKERPIGTAELMATALATMWMIQDGADAYFLGYDATYAENIAAALASPKTNHALVKNVVALRDILDKRASITTAHIRSHQGDPWNELADVVCENTSLRDTGFTGFQIPPIAQEAFRSSGKCLSWCSFAALACDFQAQYPVQHVGGSFNLQAT